MTTGQWLLLIGVAAIVVLILVGALNVSTG